MLGFDCSGACYIKTNILSSGPLQRVTMVKQFRLGPEASVKSTKACVKFRDMSVQFVMRIRVGACTLNDGIQNVLQQLFRSV